MKLVDFKNRDQTWCLLVLCFVCCCTLIQAGGPWRDGRILVKYQDGGRESAESLHISTGCSVICELRNRLELIALPKGEDVEAMVARYSAEPGVAWAEPDWIVHTSATPNESRFLNGELWGQRNTGQNGGVFDVDINAPEGWDQRSSAASVIVAVIDTGVRYDHPDLAANMWRNPDETAGDGIDNDGNGLIDDVFGINAAADSGDPMDDNGHGTHVAGTIGAVGNNGFGVVGVAWDVQIMACKFLAADGSGGVSDAVRCIDYAVANGAKVLNNSWGGGGFSQALNESISAARAEGVLFVAAAGNESTDMDRSPGYPSSYGQGNVVSVASVTRRGELSGFSNYGAVNVDLAAPGSAITSTWHTDQQQYNTISGTSMACPQVSGAAALLYAAVPGISPDDARDRLMAATQPLPALAGRCVSGGLLRLDRLLGGGLLADFQASETVGSAPIQVQFTDRSVGTINRYAWDFGDGGTSTAASPSHTFTADGRYTVAMTVFGPNGTQDSRSIDILVSPDYTHEAVAYQWRSPAAETNLGLGDDGTAVVSIPFSVTLYGEQSNSVVVGANGLIGLSEEGIGEYANGGLPQPSAPNGMMAVFWDDLNPASKGRVVTHVVGDAPAREFVVTWEGVPHFQDGDSAFSFQAVFFEGSNSIEYHYQKVASGRSTVSGGASASIGIEDSAGARAVSISVDGDPSLLADATAIRFTLPEDKRLAVSPTGVNNASGTAGGAFLPSSFDYDLRNSGDGSVNWTAAVDQGWVTLSSGSGTIAAGGSISVTATIDADATGLPPGLHVARISFDAGGAIVGEKTRELRLSVSAATGSGTLAVAPGSGFSALGNEGGPFLPRSFVYTVSNQDAKAITWRAERQATWLAVSPATGTLAPGETVDVAVSVASDAASLSADSYDDMITFRNLTNGAGTTIRNASLVVSAGTFPESTHPYANGLCDGSGGCDIQSYTHPGSPDALAITFDSLTKVEEYITDDWGDLIGIRYPDPNEDGGIGILAYTGTELAGQTIIVPSDQFEILIISDATIRDWGYRVTQVTPIISDLLESPHPYPNAFDYTWQTEVGAHNGNTYVTFSADTFLEDRYDFLRILGGAGSAADSTLRTTGYTGAELAGMTVVVSGHVVQAVLSTDSTIVEHGFRVTTITGDQDLEGSAVVETTHPYVNGADETYRIERPLADSMTLTFDARTCVETDFDYISIKNGSGLHVAGSPFTGAELAGAHIQVLGDVAEIGVSSDTTVAFFGMRVVGVAVEYPDPVPLTVVADGAGEGRVRFNGGMRQLPLQAMVRPGVEIMLESVPGVGSTFGGWTGDLDSGVSVQTITPVEGSDIDLTALFLRQSFHLELQKGWNFVGMPVEDARTLSELFGVPASQFGRSYFEPVGRRWKSRSVALPFEVGVGYWVRAENAGVSVALRDSAPANASIFLPARTWVAVSPSTRLVLPVDFSGRIWRWDGRRFVSVASGQSLQPGQAYWAYAVEQTELQP